MPVDASEAAKDPSKREYFFGAHDENRVEFTKGRDVALTPRQKGDPLQDEISALLEPHRHGGPPNRNGKWRAVFADTKLFAELREETFVYEQLVDAAGLVDRIASISFVASGSSAGRMHRSKLKPDLPSRRMPSMNRGSRQWPGGVSAAWSTRRRPLIAG